VNAVKTVVIREPKDLGKPDSYPFEFIQKSQKLDPNRVLMIGDKLVS
jgi:FMN phosphatase YigB (HAD superfamily)